MTKAKEFLDKFNDAVLFHYGDNINQTLNRMRNFCDIIGVNILHEFVPKSNNIKDVKETFYKLVDSINKCGVPCFLVVESVDSVLIGFKEMEILSDLVKRELLVIWGLDNNTFVVNQENVH